jgi:thiol-disulfide isomerase/thioredoxin
MSDESLLLAALRRAPLALGPAALTACLLVGCAAKEGATPSSPAAPVTTTADAVPATSGESPDSSLVKTPSRVKTPTDLASRSAVTVEPVSPEELQKFVADQRGKVVFVDFWATYCLPCREKFPRTLALAKKYGDQGLTAVSMSMDSPEPAFQKKILEFLRQQNSEIKNFANRLEDTDAAFAALDIVGGALPHYKIYGRNGKLRNKFGGDPDHPFDEADIERAVVAALKAN